MSTKKSSDHPTYAEMISAAILSLKDRTGSSRQAIAKYVCANYQVDADKAAFHLRRALKKGLEDGVFKTARQSGKGAGSFKLVEKKKKKPAVKKAKPSSKKSAVDAAKKAKSSAKKKPAVKAVAAKKSKAGKKSGTSKKTKAAKAIIPGKKSVIKKPKVGKKSVKASKKV